MKRTPTSQGFTLIEIIVSLAIFTVVAVIAVGAFLKIIDANKQSQSLQTAMNNTNFALESMVREMRVGTKYTCFDAGDVNNPILTQTTTLTQTQPCDFLGFTYNGIAFNSSDVATYQDQFGKTQSCNLIHAYRYAVDGVLGVTTLEKAEQPACNTPLGPFIPLVSSDLNIQSFSLQVTTATGQPKVFFLIKAYAGPSDRERTYFTVQTTASERTIRGS